MIETSDHKILSSFKEYVSHRILNNLQAYKNKTVSLYENVDERIKNMVTYSSPYAQWVYDSSVSGANIPSVLSDGTDRSDGAKFDFVNGRVFLPSGMTGKTVTVDVAVNEMNFYIDSRSEDRFISEAKFDTLYDLAQANTYIKSDSIIASCAFFRYRKTRTEDYSLGGLNMNTWYVRVIFLSLDQFTNIAMQNVCRNIINTYFPLIDQTPLNEYGDVKIQDWRYTDEQTVDQSRIVYVKDGDFVNMEIDSFSHKNPNIIVSMANFELKLPNSFFP